MKSGVPACVGVLSGLVLASGVQASATGPAPADAMPASYHAIVERNIFDLRPVPQPVTVAQPVPEPTVTLIGLMKTSGQPQVVLSVLQPGPGKQPEIMVFIEGQRRGNIEVKEIDLESKAARVVVDQNISLLKLEAAKANPAPTPVVAITAVGQGGIQRPGFVQPVLPTPPASPGIPTASASVMPNRLVRTGGSENPTLQPPLPPALRPRAPGNLAPPVPSAAP